MVRGLTHDAEVVQLVGALPVRAIHGQGFARQDGGGLDARSGGVIWLGRRKA